MGPKYSKGVRNTPLKLEHLKSMTILEVRTKAMLMSKLFGKKNLYFFENQELAEVMGMSGEEVYLCVNLFAKNAGMTKISSLDFWCGLALASSGANDDKLTFCAKILDTNSDDLLSYNEVLVLVLCATRGIACLKGLEFVPEETLDKVVMDAFSTNQKNLKDNGEIPVHILVNFLLSQELCRAYLVALGAKMPPVDTAALVTKRTFYMKELIALRCEMEEAMISMQEEEERKLLEHERGGDIEYIRSIVDNPSKSVHDIHIRRHSSIKPLASILGKQQEYPDEHLDRDKLPATHPANTLYKTDDSWQYELYNPKPDAPLNYEPPTIVLHDHHNGVPQTLSPPHTSSRQETAVNSPRTTKKPQLDRDSSLALLHSLFPNSNAQSRHPFSRQPSAQSQSQLTVASNFPPSLNRSFSILSATSTASVPSSNSLFSKAFEERFRKEWKKLPNDEMSVAMALDPMVLMAMLETLNVILPLSTARRVLEDAKRSQLGGYHFEDILYHVRRQYNAHTPDISRLSPDARLVHHWTTQWKRQWYETSRSMARWLQDIAWQRRVMQGVDRAGMSTNMAKRLAEFRAMALKRPFAIDTSFYINEEAIPKKPNAAEDRLQGVDAYAFPMRLQVMLNTVPFTNLSTKRPRDSTRLKYVDDVTRHIYMVDDYPSFQASDLLDFYNLRLEQAFVQRQEALAREQAEAIATRKLSMAFDASATDTMNTAMQQETRVLEEKLKAARRASLNSSTNPTVGTAANAQETKKRKNGDEEAREYEMVTWFAVDLKPGLEEAYAIVVREALRNWMESIPMGVRKELYHDVVCEIVTPIGDEADEESGTAEDGGTITTAASGSVATGSVAGPAGAAGAAGAGAAAAAVAGAIGVGAASVTSSSSSPSKKGTTSKSSFFAMLNKAKKRASVAKATSTAGVATRRMVLVALFHEHDRFAKLEQTLLEADLYLSRCIQSLTIDFRCAQTMEQLFARSLDYHRFQDKLFGPLEEELGEQGSNPLRFAKDLRVRKKALEALLGRCGDGDAMSREECLLLLREEGWNDRGTAPELRSRVKRMLQEKVQRIGHGELSAFGKRNIETMFYRVKNRPPPSTNTVPETSRPSTARTARSTMTTASTGTTSAEDDAGLSLWEMNDLLEKSDTQTFYSKQEYTTFMVEEELLMDRDGGLTLRGLQRYYEKHGRLAEDILRWRTGGLDALLAGYVHVKLDFDPEGLYSIFNLVEHRPLVVPHLLKVIGDLSAWKDVKIDGHVERCSELLDFLPFDRLGVPGIKDRLMQILRQPGGLIEILEFLFAKTFQADSGLIPVLRRFLSPSGFEYQSYHDPFADAVYLDAMQQEISETLQRLMDEEAERLAEEAARIQREQDAADQLIITQKVAALKEKYYAAGNILITEDMMIQEARDALAKEKAKQQAMVEALVNEGTDGAPAAAASASTASRSKGGKAAKKNEEDEESLRVLRRQEEMKQEMMTAKARAALPKMLLADPRIDLAAIRTQIIDDLIFLHRVRTVDGMSFTLEESMAIDAQRVHLEERLESVTAQIQAQEASLLEHSLAAYDILRHFTTGVSSFGWGTQDICLRGTMEGMPLISHLAMPGCGEASFLHEQEHAKKERFERRKQLAMAAVERERLRRTMTAEDHARIQRVKARKRKQKVAREAKRHFHECHRGYRQLVAENRIHQRKIPMIDWANTIKRLEQLLRLQDEPYPHALPAQILKHNVGLMYYEIYGLDHPLSEPAQYLLQEAAERILSLEEDAEDAEDEEQAERDRMKAAAAQLDPHHALDSQMMGTGESPATLTARTGLTTAALTTAPSTAAPPAKDEATLARERAERRHVRAAIKILMVIHYLQLCREADNFVALKQAMPLKHAVYDAFQSLTAAWQAVLLHGYPASEQGIFDSEFDILTPEDAVPLRPAAVHTVVEAIPSDEADEVDAGDAPVTATVNGYVATMATGAAVNALAVKSHKDAAEDDRSLEMATDAALSHAHLLASFFCPAAGAVTDCAAEIGPHGEGSPTATATVAGGIRFTDNGGSPRPPSRSPMPGTPTGTVATLQLGATSPVPPGTAASGHPRPSPPELFCGAKVHLATADFDAYRQQLHEAAQTLASVRDQHHELHRRLKQQQQQQPQLAAQLSPNRQSRQRHEQQRQLQQLQQWRADVPALWSQLTSTLPPVRWYWQELPLFTMRQCAVSSSLQVLLQEVEQQREAERRLHLQQLRQQSLDGGGEDGDLSTLGGSLSKSRTMDDFDDDGEGDGEGDGDGADDGGDAASALTSQQSSSRRRRRRLLGESSATLSSVSSTSKLGPSAGAPSVKSFLSESLSVRREKRQKFEAQRKLDARKRQEMAKQRNFLYTLIQTDQISEIFARKAGNVRASAAPQWNQGDGDGGGGDGGDGNDVDSLSRRLDEFATLRASHDEDALPTAADGDGDPHEADAAEDGAAEGAGAAAAAAATATAASKKAANRKKPRAAPALALVPSSQQTSDASLSMSLSMSMSSPALTEHTAATRAAAASKPSIRFADAGMTRHESTASMDSDPLPVATALGRR